MVPLSELVCNPVEVTLKEESWSGSISAERGKNGKVWLTCQCTVSRTEGWCSHRIDLLCGRYENFANDAPTRKALDQIFDGTLLKEAGTEADRSLKLFDDYLHAFDSQRPGNNLTGSGLGKFTDLITDLAASAAELEEALGRLRRLLDRY